MGGRASGNNRAERTSVETPTVSAFGGMNQQQLDRLINESGPAQGYAFTSLDTDRMSRELNRLVREGDIISTQENNRWHNIQSSYTKLADGWRFRRINAGTGQIYEDRTVSTDEVSDRILRSQGTDEPEIWRFRRG